MGPSTSLKGRIAVAVIAAAALQLSATSPARAIDRDAMRNILSPVFLAQNLVAVCARVDPDFARSAGGSGGHATRMIAHIRDEILAVMTREEAAPIVESAAGSARAVGLGMIRAQAGGSVEDQLDRLKQLCERTAKPIVKDVVEGHEARHDFFEKMLKDARQDQG